MGGPQTSDSAYWVGASGLWNGMNFTHTPMLMFSLFQANRYFCTFRKASATKHTRPPMTNRPSRLSLPVSRTGLITENQMNSSSTTRLMTSKIRSAMSRQDSISSGPIFGAGVKWSDPTHRAITTTLTANQTSPIAARNVVDPRLSRGGTSDTTGRTAVRSVAGSLTLAID